MNMTKALRTQVDNLWLEIQQLQVENTRLKSQVMEGELSKSSEQVPVLRNDSRAH